MGEGRSRAHRGRTRSRANELVLSAATQPEPFFVTVDGFTYQVFFESLRLPHSVSKFHILHWKDGAAVTEDCPISQTGENKHYFAPCLLEKHPTEEAAAIDAIGQLSDLTRYENRQKKAAQFSLF